MKYAMLIAVLFAGNAFALDTDTDHDGVTESYYYVDNNGVTVWEHADGDTCPTVYNPGDEQDVYGYAWVYDPTAIGVWWSWKKVTGIGPGLGAHACSTDFNGDGVSNGVDLAEINDCGTNPNRTCPMPPRDKCRVGDYDCNGVINLADVCRLADLQFQAGIDVWWTVLVNCGIVSY